jgi:hypothetical protein
VNQLAKVVAHMASMPARSTRSALERAAEYERTLNSRRAELAALPHAELIARARRHALPVPVLRSALVEDVTRHEVGGELTVMWAREDLDGEGRRR